MDEKELIRKIKSSLKAGKSDNEIILFLQNEGYKLDYATILLHKAKRTKKIVIYSIFVVLFILLVGTIAVLGGVLFIDSSSKENTAYSGGGGGGLRNPLEGYNVIFEEKKEVVTDLQNESETENDTEEKEDIYVEDIEVTAEFITYLMYGIGADVLKPNPITKSKPIINFEIEDDGFHSIVNGGIKSYKGLSDDPDISFSSTKVNLIKAMLSSDPVLVFKNSYNAGSTELIVEKSEPVLFAKGYVDFYDSLNS